MAEARQRFAGKARTPEIERRISHWTEAVDAGEMIAATAYRHGMIIVTRNTKDFEDWGVKRLNPWQRS